MSPIKTHVTAGNTQARHTRQCVQPQPDTGYPLCKHSRRCSSCHAPMKHQHTHKVQHDVQYRRDSQKNQRCRRIAHRTQQTGEEIVKERGGDAEKNDPKVLPHQPIHRDGNREQAHDRVDPQKDSGIDDECQRGDKRERSENAGAQAGEILFSVTDGEKCSAAHAEPQKDRGEKGHQRIRRANGCQRDGTEKTTDNERVGYIVKLLQQIAGDHGQSKPEHCAGDAAGSQIQNTSGRLV